MNRRGPLHQFSEILSVFRLSSASTIISLSMASTEEGTEEVTALYIAKKNYNQFSNAGARSGDAIYKKNDAT